MTAEWQVCDLTDARDPVLFNVARLPFVPETAVSFPRAGLEALARGLQKAGLDASTFVWPPEGEPDRAPYPGLRALDEVDVAVFFGREASIVRAIDQMRLVRERDVEQVFVILGASGAGKSSFLRAGLLPRLRRDSEHFIVLPPIRPESAAILGSQGLLDSLKLSLAAAGQAMSPAQVRTELASVGLAGVLSQIAPAVQPANGSDRLAEPTLVVPIDQAEELFGSDGQEEARQFLARMVYATAASALAGFSAELNSIAAPMRHSLTYDQGKELSRHKDLTARTGVAVYFCDPHSPWQRGTCENTNGLLRQYLPKGTDLSIYTQDELDAIADSMNSRPRATHNWLTPLQVFAQTLAGSHKAAPSVQ